MKVAVVYGTEHKGSTYNIVQLFLKKLENEVSEVSEFFLPRDMSHFCRGCAQCFMKSENSCPDYEQVSKIREGMEKADLLIFTSPVYAYHASGQMKTLLDHFAYQWMVHRPNKTMFKKIGLVITTAAGAGMRKTHTDIIDSLSYWGVGKIFRLGRGVASINWDGVKKENKEKIEREVDRMSSKIISASKNVTPGPKVRILFYLMRFAQRKGGFNPADNNYWKEQGWLEGVRPW